MDREWCESESESGWWEKTSCGLSLPDDNIAAAVVVVGVVIWA
jgi:hypothetical protein